MEKISRLPESSENLLTGRDQRVSLLLEMSDRFEHSSVIRGYHIYKDIFTPTIGKTFQGRRETDNDHDDYAVAITEDDTIVGHVPRTISVPCDLFLRKGGTISCTVTGPPQYSRDLEQGGQDVPCKLVFSGPVKDDFKQKVQRLLQKAPKLERSACLGITPLAAQSDKNNTQTTTISGALSASSSAAQANCVPVRKLTVHVSSTPSIEIDDTGSSSDESDGEEEEGNPKKKVHVDGEEVINLLEGQWLQIEKFILTPSDRNILVQGKRLNDHHINFAQCLLKKQFTAISGLQLSLLQGRQQQAKIKNGIQIVYLNNRLHWCVASTISCAKNEVKVYDSVFSSPDSEMRTICLNLFDITKKPKLSYQPVQKQEGGDDCSVFSIAFATGLLHKQNPVSVQFAQSSMRSHLLLCFEQQVLTPFTATVL